MLLSHEVHGNPCPQLMASPPPSALPPLSAAAPPDEPGVPCALPAHLSSLRCQALDLRCKGGEGVHCALFAAYFFFTEPCISPILHKKLIFLYNPTRMHTGARWGGVKWSQFHPGCWYCADFVFSGPWVSCGLTKKVNLHLEIPRDGVCGPGSSVGRAVHVRPHGCLIGQLVPLLLLLTACSQSVAFPPLQFVHKGHAPRAAFFCGCKWGLLYQRHYTLMGVLPVCNCRARRFPAALRVSLSLCVASKKKKFCFFRKQSGDWRFGPKICCLLPWLRWSIPSLICTCMSQIASI